MLFVVVIIKKDSAERLARSGLAAQVGTHVASSRGGDAECLGVGYAIMTFENRQNLFLPKALA